MIRANVLCVNELVAMAGSTNSGNRSFGISDEVNLALRYATLSNRQEDDPAAGLRESRRISLEWRNRPATERTAELFGWMIEKQQ